MSSDELKENIWYSIETSYIKGRFQYAGQVDFQSVKKYLFQCFATDLYLTEDELVACVGVDKREKALDELTKQAQDLDMGY